MENKKKMILSFVAVALMIAVAFVGFVAIAGEGSDAEETEIVSVTIGEGEPTSYSDLSKAVKAVNDAISGDVEFKLLDNISITTAGASTQAAIWFTYTGGTITVDGQDNTITYNATQGSGLNALGFNTGVKAIVNDLTIDGNKVNASSNYAYHGINIYGAESVTLDNVKVKNVHAAGIIANSESIIMKDCDVSENCGWGGVNVDIGSRTGGKSNLTIQGTFAGKIWTESLGVSTVTYDGAKITTTMTTKDGNSNWKFWYSSEDLNVVVQEAIVNAKDVNKAANDFVITLMDNCSGSGVYVGKTDLSDTDLSDKNITIDLNGKTYTGDKNAAGSTTTQNQLLHLESGTFIIKDGTLAVKSGNDSFKFLVQNYTDIKATNVKFDGSNLIQVASSSHRFTFAVNVEKGSVSITGGSLIASTSDTALHNYALGICADTSYTSVSRTVTLNGTEIVGDILRWCSSNENDVLTISDSSITGSILYDGANADPKIVITGKVEITGNVLVRSTTVMDVTKGTVILNLGSSFKLVTGESTIVSQIDVDKGTLTLSTNVSGGFDAILDGEATLVEDFTIGAKDKLTIGEGSTLTLEGKLIDNGTVVVNGKLIASETNFVQIYSGKTLVLNEGAVITGKIVGNDSNSVVVDGLKAGSDGITFTSGSLKINGEIVSEGTTAGVTVKIVSGDNVIISGQLNAGATMEIEEGTTVTIENKTTFTSNGTITNKGSIVNAGTLTNASAAVIVNSGSIENTSSIVNNGIVANQASSTITNSGSIENKSSIVNAGTIDNSASSGTVTNTGTLKMTDSSTVSGSVVNNGIVADERASGSTAVSIDTSSTGAVVTKTNADSYGKDVKVIVEDPETTPVSEGTITSTSDSYGFVNAVTTTGKLEIVLNDGYKTYTLTIPSGITIAMGTVVSVEYLDFTSDTTKYEITTPGITEFSVKVPVQTGFKSAKVYCDGSTDGISNVRYNASSGYVTFDAGHNSTFTIVLSNATPSSGTSSDAIDEDTAFVAAIIVLVVAILALAVVIKRN